MPDKNQRPPYIFRQGGFLERPPFEQQKTRMYGFMVKGDAARMQTLIDAELNAVAAGSQYHFKPICDYVMLSFANIEHCYSTYPTDYAKGYGQEIDVCFWIPVGNIVTHDGKEYLHEIFWYTPFIWVNSPIAMIAGRNIFGYPKTIGEFVLPPDDKPDFFKASVNSFKTYSPETAAEWNEVLSVKNLEPNQTPAEKWHDMVDAIKGIYEFGKDSLHYPPDIHGMEQIAGLLLHPQIPQIFLKQFPDETGDKAVYQALLAAPAKINQFSSGGLLLGDYQLTVEDVASIPLADSLGLQIGSQPIDFGFWLDFGFSVSDARILVDNSRIPPKKKIAILGSGIAACTAAMELTSQPDWQDRYEVTLYQQGWRLGGKCASGRNAKFGQRIEEHGLHIWFGFYKNAFRVLQDAYDELNRPAGAPLATWEEALKPHNFVVLMEHFNGQWIPWPIEFPNIEGNPADGDEACTLWAMARTLYAWLKQWLDDIPHALRNARKEHRCAPSSEETSILERIEDGIEDVVDDLKKFTSELIDAIANLPNELNVLVKHDRHALAHLLEKCRDRLEDEIEEELMDFNRLRRLYICCDLSIAALKGMLEDDVFEKGFDVINNIDFKAWLAKHGANQQYTVNSAPVRALYDLVFAYMDGDIQRANIEAGTCLRGAMRIIFCYQGGVMWKMQAGMGDTIFTPFYQVLKRRGVKFEFFHQVQNLELNESKTGVQKIHLTRQVDLIDGPTSYNPLVNVLELSCWPSDPQYSQIVPDQAALLQEHQVDLEDFWSNWPALYEQKFGKPLPNVTLERGTDFDLIIDGTSVASLPVIAGDLLDNSASLRAANDHVKTVVTQAYQLWTNPTLQELGWSDYSDCGEEPVLTAWAEPIDTWAAMNQLLDKENWQPQGCDPQNVAYFCGVQPVNYFPPRSDHQFPTTCKAQVRENCITEINTDLSSLWPNAFTSGQFQWTVLTDPLNQIGEDRFNSQYWRSNVSPSERYVQSVVNSTQYRIDTKVTDFDNIYFTGDWIRTGLNAGCVEAATMAGMQTARAISGRPIDIKGEFDFGRIPEN